MNDEIHRPTYNLQMDGKTGLTQEPLHDLYPCFNSRNYSLPSAHFNKWILEPHPNDKQQIFTWSPSKKSSDSAIRGSEAHQRVLSSFQELCSTETNPEICPMFIFSEIVFEKILKNNIKQRLKGEADLLIIQKRLGLIVAEIKAYGDISEASSDENLHRVLEKTCKADNPTNKKCRTPARSPRGRRPNVHDTKEEEAETDKERFMSQILKTLALHDVPVSYVIVLPNVSRDDLERVAPCYSRFMKVLRRFGDRANTALKSDVDVLRTRCLCKEEFPEQFKCLLPEQMESCERKLSMWWQGFADSLGEHTIMSDDDYAKVISAFVGPNSEITVWSQLDSTMTSHTRDMRTPADVIHEVGQRYQKYVLYPELLDVYENCRDKQVYLCGPPGSGKTLLLILKGAKWLATGRRVLIISSNKDGMEPLPVVLDIKKQIEKSAERIVSNNSSPTSLHPVWIASSTSATGPKTVITQIKKYLASNNIQANGVVFLVDKVDVKVTAVLKILNKTYKNAFIWSAGSCPCDLPKQFQMKELQKCVRRPSQIQVLLKFTNKRCKEGKHCYANSYMTSSTVLTKSWKCCLPSDGPPIKWFTHSALSHCCSLLDCSQCGHQLGQYLTKELHITKQENRLRLSDVLIVTPKTSLKSSKFLEGLEATDLKVEVIEGSQKREEDVAFPGNFVVATNVQLIPGLERKVVVFIPEPVQFDKMTELAEEDHQLDKSASATLPENIMQQRLRAVGEDNRKALWYVMSRSLSHGVIFHFDNKDNSTRRLSSSTDKRWYTRGMLSILVVLLAWLMIIKWVLGF